MAALGVDDRVELFQSAGHGVDNARVALYGDPIGIELIGGTLASLDRACLLAVIGHEIGHCVAHCANPEFAWARSASQSASKRAYAMAAELTADRFGLLACRDLDAVLRLEMRTAAGESATSIRFDTHSYLSQCRAISEEILARGGTAHGSSHPEHYVRGYAEWLFSESDVYAAITGAGDGTRPIDEVDATLGELLGVRRATSAPAVEHVPSRPVTDAAVVGHGDDEAVAERPAQVAADVLTDGARRTLAAAGKALATMAGAVAPSLGRVARAARDHLAGAVGEEDAEGSAADPLDEERRELLARFAELERREKK
jgi:hypothetical protein